MKIGQVYNCKGELLTVTKIQSDGLIWLKDFNGVQYVTSPVLVEHEFELVGPQVGDIYLHFNKEYKIINVDNKNVTYKGEDNKTYTTSLEVFLNAHYEGEYLFNKK